MNTWRLLLIILVLVSVADCASVSSKPPPKAKPKVAARSSVVQNRSAPQPRPSFYVVQPGETLSVIARRFGLNERNLLEWNRLASPVAVHAGQTLFLFKPNPEWVDKAAGGMSDLEKHKNGFYGKKSENSIASKTILKLYWHWPLKGVIQKGYSGEDEKGVEIAGDFGAPVLAAADGKVVYSGDGMQGYNNLLIIKHDDQFLTAYANNSERLVEEGVSVKQGQPIARVGSMGGRNYLHFEIRKNGIPVNPADYLPDKAN